MIFSMTHWLFWFLLWPIGYWLLSSFVSFPIFLLLLISNLITLWLKDIHCIILILITISRTERSIKIPDSGVWFIQKHSSLIDKKIKQFRNIIQFFWSPQQRGRSHWTDCYNVDRYVWTCPCSAMGLEVWAKVIEGMAPDEKPGVFYSSDC